MSPDYHVCLRWVIARMEATLVSLMVRSRFNSPLKPVECHLILTYSGDMASHGHKNGAVGGWRGAAGVIFRPIVSAALQKSAVVDSLTTITALLANAKR